MKSILILSSVLMTFAGGELVAQDLHSLQQGVRIRIQPNEGHSMVGSFLGVRNDSLRLLREGADSSFRSYPLAGIRNVDVSRGQSRVRGGVASGIYGLVIGGVVGAVLGALSYSKPSEVTGSRGELFGGCFVLCSRGSQAAAAGVLVGVSGMLVGSIYGVVQSRENWEKVPLTAH